MKLFFTSLIFILSRAVAIAGDEKNIVGSALKSATVYRSGAELVHTAKASLVQGNNELIIDGISNKVDINSIQVGTDNTITILSVEFSTDYLKPKIKSAVVRRLEDSLDLLKKDVMKLQTQIKTNKELSDLLKANKTIGGTQTGVNIAELIKMVDYYKAKSLELEQEISVWNEKLTDINEIITRLNRQIHEEEQKNIKSSGKLILQLKAAISGNYNFTVSYLTPVAYWTPTYDIKADNISKPVQIAYKAKIVQTTGIDWKQVKLSLSTTTPSRNSTAPLLSSWFLVYVNPANDFERSLAGKANSIPGAPNQLNEVVVTGYSTRVRGENSADDAAETLFVVNGNIVSREEFKKIDKRAIKETNILKGDQASAIYGSRASAGAVVVTLKENLGDYVTVNDNELDVVFEIDLPYDVPSNGKDQSVVLKEFTAGTVYKYYSAPKLDKESYLLGEIADWESLNLLAGEANIMFEGTYIGRTYIDPNSTSDTMNLTLGRDKRVVVKREKLKDFSSVKFLGTSKKQVFTYEITVKNNKKEKVDMILKDQFPISTNKDIEVELIESSDASVNNETGVLTWKLELGPGASKKYRISYSVKYPKEKIINVN